MTTAEETIVEDINSIWNPERFHLPRIPLVIGKVPQVIMDSYKENVLDMPIKLANKPFTVPPAANSSMQIITACIAHETSINPKWEDYYCYLTINQGDVEAGDTQRVTGAHFDGMQGDNYKEKFNVCHSYLVCDALPTIFYTHEFDASKLDASKHNWFKEFDRQKKEGFSYSPEPYELILKSAYNIHECAVATEKTKRTFVRIEFSLKKFNREGNTLNPLLDTSDWEYEPKPIPEHLI